MLEVGTETPLGARTLPNIVNDVGVIPLMVHFNVKLLPTLLGVIRGEDAVSETDGAATVKLAGVEMP